jgi:hypothetical protein
MSDPSIGAMSIGGGIRSPRRDDLLKFLVEREEHFESVIRIAVSDHPQKFLMLEAAAPEGNPSFEVNVYYAMNANSGYVDDPFASGDTTYSGANLFQGRLVHLNVGSDRSIRKAREWIGHCDISHSKCPKLAYRPLPTRVLEILPNSTRESLHVRLLETQGQVGQYAALSYCWGGPQSIILEVETLASFKESINTAELPHSIIDALVCTLKLGLQYLWVDALCIIQGSQNGKNKSLAQEDQEREIKIMDQIYKNSYITLQAANAKTCKDGFLQTRKQRAEAIRVQCQYSANAPPTNLILTPGVDIVMPRPPIQEPIDQRAWTLQEGLLAPRLLMYTEAQLFFKCPCGFQKDGGEATWQSFTMASGMVRVAEENRGLLGHIEDLQPRSADQICEDWARVVIEYSFRNITVSSDKLPALAGLATSFGAVTHDTYLAGCWKEGILYQISWMPGNLSRIPDRHHVNLARCSRPSRWRAPSWSWASVDGSVWFPNRRSGRPSEKVFIPDPNLAFIRCVCTPLSKSLAFGELANDDNALVLRGHLRSLAMTTNKDLQIVTIFGLATDSSPAASRESFLGRKYVGKEVGLGNIMLDVPETVDDYVKRQFSAEPWWCFLLGSFCGNGPEDLNQIAMGLVLRKSPKVDGKFERVGTFQANVRNSDLRTTQRELSDWFKEVTPQEIDII